MPGRRVPPDVPQSPGRSKLLLLAIAAGAGTIALLILLIVLVLRQQLQLQAFTEARQARPEPPAGGIAQPPLEEKQPAIEGREKPSDPAPSGLTDAVRRELFLDAWKGREKLLSVRDVEVLNVWDQGERWERVAFSVALDIELKWYKKMGLPQGNDRSVYYLDIRKDGSGYRNLSEQNPNPNQR